MMIFIALSQLIISNNIPVYFEENTTSQAFQASFLFHTPNEEKTSFIEKKVFATLLSQAGSVGVSQEVSSQNMLSIQMLNALNVSFSFLQNFFNISIFSIDDNIEATLQFLDQSFFRPNFIQKDTESLLRVQKELVASNLLSKSGYVEFLLNKIFSLSPTKAENPLDFFTTYSEKNRMSMLQKIQKSPVIFFVQGSKKNLEKFTSFLSKKNLQFKEKFSLSMNNISQKKEKFLFIFEDETLDSSKIFLKNSKRTPQLSHHFYEKFLTESYLFGLDSLFMQEFREQKKLVYSINGSLYFDSNYMASVSELMTSTSRPQELLKILFTFLKKDLFSQSSFKKKLQAFPTRHSIQMQNFKYRTQLLFSNILFPRKNEDFSTLRITKDLSFYKESLLQSSIFITGPKNQVKGIDLVGYKKIIITDPVEFLKKDN